MAYLVKDVKELLGLMKRLQGERSSSDFASDLGISKQYLTDIYKGRRDPGDSVLRALNVTRQVAYLAGNNSALLRPEPSGETQTHRKKEKDNANIWKRLRGSSKAARPRKLHP